MNTTKRVIIIGATSGLGRELALILAREGYAVGITGRRTEKLAELKDTCPDAFRVKAFDVTDTDNVATNLEELTRELGGVDIVVINAGTGYTNPELDFAKESKAIDVNVTGFTCAIDWAYRFFKEQGDGHIVATSSVAGVRGNRWAPAYGATKSYIINYLQAIRAKAHKEALKIKVTDIRPGFVDTELINGDNKELFWVANTKTAAQQMYSAIRHRRKVAYVTKRWRIVGVGMRLLPRWIYERV